ncbi:hypothetical protein FRC03_008324 [Tulasnella sp. 419]|nr:hypothetical protein FRC03_008324 [Tulasnella sp. 419]
MIGENIRENYESFDVAFKLGDDMAVHTWSHQYMTGLSNEEAFGQLAWTMQIIADLTGGRLPKYWRPPFGDSDNRYDSRGELGNNLVTMLTDAFQNSCHRQASRSYSGKLESRY